jgi:hypothetical protein
MKKINRKKQLNEQISQMLIEIASEASSLLDYCDDAEIDDINAEQLLKWALQEFIQSEKEK